MNIEANTKEYLAGVQVRADELLTAIDKRAGNSLWTAYTIMSLGGDKNSITAAAKKTLSKSTVGPFEVFPTMMLVSRWKEELPGDVLALAKQCMTRTVQDRGNTENHWLMYYTANLLAAEYWTDVDTWWNGLPREAMLAEAMRWILGMIERTAVYGHHEYDSPLYHIYHMLPMMVITDHTSDEYLRHQAEQTLNLFVAEMALEYFHGSWAGGHSREGYRQNTWNRTGVIQMLQYLYFGGESFNPDYHVQPVATYALTSPYRPPAILASIALDKDTPCVVKKTKAPRNIYRHVTHEADRIRKYTYLSESFALGSTQLGLPGPPAGPIDMVSWDLTWQGPKHGAKIVCNHPYRDPRRFSAFLAGPPQVVGRGVASDKPYLQFPDRLFGASPYERIMQHEGAIIVLYRIPGDDEAPYVNLYLPKTINWIEKDGWLFADLESFYVALMPIGLYTWQAIRESNNSGTMVTEGDLIDGWLLRIEDIHAGLVLEAVEAKGTGTFQSFTENRINRKVDLNGWPDDQRVAVENYRGEWLEMHYNGPHMVNGEPINYSYPLFEAPGVEAELGTGKIVFRRGDDVLELDFGIDPENPLIPMRSVG